MANFRKRTKIKNGKYSIGVTDILTVTVNGAPPPATMDIDMRAGRVQWTDQNNLGDPGPYVFEGTHRTPAETAAIETPADVKRTQDFAKDVGITDSFDEAVWQAMNAIVAEMKLLVPKSQEMIDLVAKVEAIKAKNPKA